MRRHKEMKMIYSGRRRRAREKIGSFIPTTEYDTRRAEGGTEQCGSEKDENR